MCFSDYKNLGEPSRGVKLSLGVSFLLSVLVGSLGNIVVLIITCKVMKVRPTVPNSLILALAITDLLTIFFAFTPTLLVYFVGLNLGQAALCDYQATALNFFFLVSVALVAFMSLDRCLALSLPFFYKNSVVFDCKKMAVGLVIFCCIAVAISLLPALGVGTNAVQYPGSFCLFELNAADASGRVILFINITLLTICMVAVVACNSAVSWTSYRMLSRSRQQRPSVDVEQTGTSFVVCSTEECRFMKLSIIVMVTFVAFWSVFLIRALLIQSGFPFNSCWDIISIRLATFHTLCNPWIYLLSRRQYRKGFWYIIQTFFHYLSCKKLCVPESSLSRILGIPDAKVSYIDKGEAQAHSKQTLIRSRSGSVKQDEYGLKDCGREISADNRDVE